MRIILLSLLLLLSGCTSKPQYYLYIYYAKTCPICHSILTTAVPLIEDKYGNSMKIYEMDIDEDKSLELYAKTCSLLDNYYVNENSGDVPFIVLDGYFAALGYEAGMQEELVQAIDQAINGEKISFDFDEIYYFQDGKSLQ